MGRLVYQPEAAFFRYEKPNNLGRTAARRLGFNIEVVHVRIVDHRTFLVQQID